MLLRILLPLSLLACAAASAQQPWVENKGQWPAAVTHRAEVPGAVLWLQGDEILVDRFDDQTIGHRHAPVHASNDTLPISVRHHAVRLRFMDATNSGSTQGEQAGSTRYNYLLGNDPAHWGQHALGYTSVLRKDLLPGIHLRATTANQRFKYDLIVDPGSDPSAIRFTYDGATAISLRDKDLVVGTTLGDLVESIPLAYQERNGKQESVDVRYTLKQGVVGFRVGRYDPTLPLIIDPTLDFSTFSGSTANNFGYTSASDAMGFLYAGSSIFGQGYPTTIGAFDVTYNGGAGLGGPGVDMALSKFDTTGTFLIWSTYLGGNGDDLPHSLIVNAAHELVLLGTTGSTDFPTTPDAYDRTHRGGSNLSIQGLGTRYPLGTDLVVARLAADGSSLLASTTLGGSGNDGLNADPALKYNYADEIRGEVILDAAENVIVVTCTRSTDFPTTAGAHRSSYLGGSHDGVVFKMPPTLDQLLWSSYLGGSGADAAYAIDVDSDGTLLICGGTNSGDLPTTPGVYAEQYLMGRADAFVVRMAADGGSLLQATYYGSDAYDQAYFVELDHDGAVYLLGQTMAPFGQLVNNVEYSVPNGGQFLVKLDPQLRNAVWQSRFGATSGPGANRPSISPTAFLVDHCDKIYLAGWGSAILGDVLTTTGLPVTPDAFQSSTDGNDFYLAVFDIDMQGSGPLYATFFGGPNSAEHVDGGTSRFDKNGRVYQSACAGCGGFDDFPIHPRPGALSAVNNNSCNLGVFKFDFDAPLVTAIPTANGPFCAGDPIHFSNHGRMGTSFHWDLGDGSTSNLRAPVHTYSAPGSYNVTLAVADPDACNGSDTARFMVQVLNAAPDLTTSNDTLLCGPSAVLELHAFTRGVADGFAWRSSTVPSTVLSSDSTLRLAPPAAGTYYVEARVANGCIARDSVNVAAVLTELVLDPDTVICTGVQVELSLHGDPQGSSIVWQPEAGILSGQGTASITVSPTTTTQYRVTVLHPQGCIWTDSAEVVVSPMQAGTVAATATPSEVLPGNPVQLQALPTGAAGYSWTPAAPLNDPTRADPTAVVQQTTTFTVTVTDRLCSHTASTTVVVHELVCADPDIYVPNAFTPDGDGRNDLFRVRARHITELELQVFDRWGARVFHTTAVDGAWDGTYRGKPVDPAVYVYHLDALCVDGQRYIHQGNVTVVR